MSYYDHEEYNRQQREMWQESTVTTGGTGGAPQGEDKPPKKKGGVAKFIGKTVAAALIFCLVASAGFYGLNKAFKIIPEQEPVAVSNHTEPAAIRGTSVSNATTVNDVSELVDNVMPSVVQVTNVSVRQYQGFFGQMFQQQYGSAGSGFIIGDDDKYIFVATNNHVVTNSQEVTITFFDETAVEAEIQGTYQNKDVAVIRVDKEDIPEETLSAIKAATLGDSSQVKIGQGAVVIGNALGYGTSVSAGIISALDREVSAQDHTGYTITNRLIQTDASVNQGNSGGPLLNLKGEVIGIVSVRDYSNEADNIGYAIPINQAAEIMDQLVSSGEYSPESDETALVEPGKAYLGIYGGMDIDEATSMQYDMPKGVYVSAVVEGSAAESAGIKKGDIITGFNGEPIGAMTELQKAVAGFEPGESVSVTFAIAANNYMEKTAQVTLTERPAE